MRAARISLLVASLAAGALAGCVLDLNPRVSCGDGFIDRLAGEECEPGVESSWSEACVGVDGTPPGPEVCDPLTCKLDPAVCDLCGNGKLDPGEACDGKELGDATCEFGFAACTADCELDLSACQTCGDGKLDPAEECEWSVHGDLTIQKPCTELDSNSVGHPYGGGSATLCRKDCTYDRSDCSFCGNGVRETGPIKDREGNTIFAPVEVCDGDIPDLEALSDFCGAECGTSYEATCRFSCDECVALALPTDGDLQCCTAHSLGCPYDPVSGKLEEDRLPCCWTFKYPDDPRGPCEEYKQQGKPTLLICR